MDSATRSDDGAATIPVGSMRERFDPPPWFGHIIWTAIRAYAVLCNIFSPDASTVAVQPETVQRATSEAAISEAPPEGAPAPAPPRRFRSPPRLDGLPSHYLNPSNPRGTITKNARTNNMADPHSLARTIIGLTFQGILAVAVASMIPSSSAPSTGHADHQEGFKLFGVLMLVAFAGSFSAIFLSRYHRAAAILQNIGSLAIIIGFFLLTSIFFPSGVLTWICWLIAALTVIAIPFALF